MERGIIRNERDFIDYIHSWRFIKLFIAVIAACFAIVWIILVWNENRITSLDPEDVILADASEFETYLDGIVWERDLIPLTKDYVNISGWIVRPGVPIDRVSIRLVLKNLSTGEYSVLPTEVVEREDVSEYIDDDITYDYSGFRVKVPYWDELDVSDYEMLVQYHLNDYPMVYVPLNTTIKTWPKELENAE